MGWGFMSDAAVLRNSQSRERDETQKKHELRGLKVGLITPQGTKGTQQPHQRRVWG